MGKTTVQAPAAPDYAASAAAATNADISSLPLRNAINAASTLGTRYTDPNTGQSYDFSGLGQADVNHDLLMQQLRDSPEATQALLDLSTQFGPQFAQAARDQLQVTDPTGFALRDQLGGKLAGGQGSIESLMTPQGAGAPPQYEKIDSNGPALAQIGSGPDFARLGDAPSMAGIDLSQLPKQATIGDAQAMQRFNMLPQLQGLDRTMIGESGQQAAGRGLLEQQVFDELARAGTPNAALQRATEQAARARGAATGNILGDASALQESLKVQLANQQLDAQRRNDALGLLASGQGTSDTANRLALAQQGADLASAGFNNTASQQQYQNAMGNTGFNNAAAQQDFQNKQATAGFNNTAGNQGFQNIMAALGLNNASAQQNFQNQGTTAQFNNAAAQQGFQNQATATQANNDSASQAFQNAMNAIGQRNQATQNTFGAQQGQLQQQAGARQQDLANIQSFLGLQPIVTQGAQLSGLQQGAAPFATGSGYNSTLTNPNAAANGTQFASNVFGTQGSIYNTQMANNQSPFGAIVGAGIGAMTGGLGQLGGMALGNTLFPQTFGALTKKG